MRNFLLSLFSLFLAISINGQVAEMKWELDYELYLKLANDSNYTYDIREAFHVKNTSEFASDFVFYPVNPGEEFASVQPTGEEAAQYNTLWSALNAKIGGGWIHFTNCIAYALETGKLDLESPLMKRPESNWKPKPMTESYKRTKNWMYYVPVSQKNAQKEYKARLNEGAMNDLNSMPASYVELLLNTSQNDYDNLKATGKKQQVAQIDLVKVLLGSNYLGEAQINYMSNMILEAVKTYSSNMLPSVIVFDEYDAAAVMSLNADGYKIEEVVFRSAAALSDEAVSQRRAEIESIIDKINAYNQNSFKKRLGNYYQN